MIFIIVLGVGIGLMRAGSQPTGPSKALPSAAAASPVSPVKHIQTSVGVPVRLEIPKIKVDASLEQTAITSRGELGVPADPANAAWYDQGSRPGEPGNAVIDGHFGYRDHIPAVFDNLHALQEGDKIYVKDEKGVTTAFVVRELRTYASDEYAPSVFQSSDGKAHLNLITCEGTWSETRKSFSNRLVVFADKTTD